MATRDKSEINKAAKLIAATGWTNLNVWFLRVAEDDVIELVGFTKDEQERRSPLDGPTARTIGEALIEFSKPDWQ